jgi:hypothetical protein
MTSGLHGGSANGGSGLVGGGKGDVAWVEPSFREIFAKFGEKWSFFARGRKMAKKWYFLGEPWDFSRKKCERWRDLLQRD